MELQPGKKVCNKIRFEVLDYEVEGILGMPFLKQFNPQINWTTGSTTIDGYTILLVDHKAYNYNSRLEIVCAKAFITGLKQSKYAL